MTNQKHHTHTTKQKHHTYTHN